MRPPRLPPSCSWQLLPPERRLQIKKPCKMHPDHGRPVIFTRFRPLDHETMYFTLPAPPGTTTTVLLTNLTSRTMVSNQKTMRDRTWTWKCQSPSILRFGTQDLDQSKSFMQVFLGTLASGKISTRDSVIERKTENRHGWVSGVHACAPCQPSC